MSEVPTGERLDHLERLKTRELDNPVILQLHCQTTTISTNDNIYINSVHQNFLLTTSIPVNIVKKSCVTSPMV